MFARDHKVWMTWRGLVALVLILALPSNIAFGGLTDATWVGPPDGAWSVADHWDPAIVPNGSTYNVLIDTDPGVLSSVLLSGTYTAGNLTVDLGDMLRITNGSNLYVSPGPVHNNGTIQLEATSSYTYFRPGAAEVTLDGTGSLVMGDANRNRIYADVWTNRLVHTGNHTIRGSGNIGANNLLLTNNSLIIADQAPALTVDLAGDATHENFNTGIMQAIDGATLAISGSPINNESGTIIAQDGSLVDLSDNTHIYNGQLETQGSGTFRVLGSVWLTDVANAGSLSITNGANCYVRGDIDNAGTLSVDGSSSYTYLRLDVPDTQFDGSGSIALGDSFHNRIYGDAWTNRLTNLATHTIRGGGNIGANNLLLTNAGTVVADRDGIIMYVDLGSSGYDNFNTGVMRATGGGILSLYGSLIDNTGGTIEALADSAVELTSGTHIYGGTLTSDGTGLIRVPSGQAAYLDSVTHTGQLSVHNAANMRIRGPITNDGVMDVGTTGASFTYLYLDTPTATLTGSGEVVLTEGNRNQITASAWTHRLTHTGAHTIRGGGNIGANSLLLTNEATIRADALEGVMAIDLGGDAENENFNTGVLESATGSTLQIHGSAINNADGIVRAQTGALVQLTGGTIIYNGTLTTEGDGLIETASSNAAYLQNVTNEGHISVANAGNMRVRQTITNNGTISVDSPGSSNTYLYLEQAATLTGDGEVVLDDHSRNYISANNAQNRLTNTGNHTIRGGGSIGANNMLLTNESLITADRDEVTMSVDTHNGDVSYNTGIMQAENGGILSLYGSVINNDNGEIRALDGSFVDLANQTHVFNGVFGSEGDGIVRVPSNQDAFIENVTSNAHISVENAANLRIRGTVANEGRLVVNSPGNSDTHLYLDQATATLTGSGEVMLEAAARNRISANAWTHRLINTDMHVIRGGGSLGVNGMLLTNNATIQADLPEATMAIDLAGNAENENFNTGIMQAVNGGILAIHATPLNNTGGAIRALNGSTVNLQGGTVVYGGTLTTQGSGIIQTPSSNDAYIQDLANEGHVSVQNAANLRILGTVVNNGTIAVDSTGTSNTYLYLEQPATLAGTGEVVLGPQSRNIISANAWTHVLTNAAGHTIRGAGQIGANNLGLINQGSIVADAGMTMTLDLAQSAFDNQGALRVTAGSVMSIAPSPFTTSGSVMIDDLSILSRNGDYVQTAGTTTVEGELAVSGGIDLQGGTLEGTGLVDADVLNSGGIVGPGVSPGTLLIDGDYEQDAAAHMRIELGGTGEGAFDLLDVTGTATLAGTLTIAILDEYDPMPGDTFVILTAGSIDGTFDSVVLEGLQDGLCEDVVYTDTDIAVTVIGTVITEQPEEQTVCQGAFVSFTAAYGGAGPHGFQWRKDGVDIPGEQGDTLSIDEASTDDAGLYDVVIDTICGTMISETAQLIVNTPPAITGQPSGDTLCEGAPFTLSVAAIGTEPLEYEWRLDGEVIPGEGASELTIDAVTTEDAGVYDVVITNVCGEAISVDAVLTVNTFPTIATQPISDTLCVGEPFEIDVTAEGTAPLDYVWRKDGETIPGEQSAILTIDAVTVDDAGTYDVVITNVCGNATSTGAPLVVWTPPTITAGPQAATVCEGDPITLTVEVSGSTPFDYAWRKDGMDLPGEHGASLVIEAASPDDAGVYEVMVINNCSETAWVEAELIVNIPGLADMDLDCDVALDDFAAFSSCLTGPDAGVATGCELADVNADGHVDLMDLADMMTLFTGTP